MKKHAIGVLLEIWRRGQDSNLQARKGGSFQDYCITNYATPPNESAKQRLYPMKISNSTLEMIV
jgi:hypothetical protein